MKVVMIGVVALLLGVGGGAFLSGTKVKDRILEEVAEAEHAATAAAEAAIMDSIAAVADGQDDGGVTPQGASPDPSDATSAEDSVTPVPTAEPLSDGVAEAEAAATRAAEEAAATAEADAEAAAVAAGLQEEGARKLAKIFGAMQAPAAADVLQQMSDGEIEMILQHMNDRMAAQILGVFDPARAAALSRVVLGTSGTRR